MYKGLSGLGIIWKIKFISLEKKINWQTATLVIPIILKEYNYFLAQLVYKILIYTPYTRSSKTYCKFAA